MILGPPISITPVLPLLPRTSRSRTLHPHDPGTRWLHPSVDRAEADLWLVGGSLRLRGQTAQFPSSRPSYAISTGQSGSVVATNSALADAFINAPAI